MKNHAKMNLTKKPLRCTKCVVGGISFDKYCRPGDGRPQFKCTRCGHVFTYGKDGGKYAVLIPKKEDEHYLQTTKSLGHNSMTEFVCRTCGCDAPAQGPWTHGEQPKSFGGGQCTDSVGVPRGTSFKDRELRTVALTGFDAAKLHSICDSVGVPKVDTDGQTYSIETRVLTMSLMLHGRIDTAAVIVPLAESVQANNKRESALRTGIEELVEKWLNMRETLLTDRRVQEASAIKGCVNELRTLITGQG